MVKKSCCDLEFVECLWGFLGTVLVVQSDGSRNSIREFSIRISSDIWLDGFDIER